MFPVNFATYLSYSEVQKNSKGEMLMLRRHFRYFVLNLLQKLSIGTSFG